MMYVRNVQNKWIDFMESATRASKTAIAAKIGVQTSTITRWSRGEVDPKPRQVVAFARAYDQSPISALIAAGYLTLAEIDMEHRDTVTKLADFSELELAQELVRRIEEGGVDDKVNAPIDLDTHRRVRGADQAPINEADYLDEAVAKTNLIDPTETDDDDDDDEDV